MKNKFFILFIVAFIFLTCAASFAQDSSIIKTSAPASPKDIVIKYGTASFYAAKFNGRKTSNGSIYNSTKLTAACNVLPLGTWVKVTNLRNKKTVIVQINDHLHHRNKRLVDLSRAAAKKLGFIGAGTTRVKVEVLGKLKKKNYTADKNS